MIDERTLGNRVTAPIIQLWRHALIAIDVMKRPIMIRSRERLVLHVLLGIIVLVISLKIRCLEALRVMLVGVYCSRRSC